MGHQVVVSLDTRQGDLGVFFPTDGQLSDDMCKHNDLIGYTDANGVRQGGFFSDKRRVRAQRFRGEKSDGYWTPISTLAWTGDVSKCKDGDTLTALNGKEVCQKYYTPATLRAMKQGVGKVKRKKHDIIFPEHFDTSQFKYFTGAIHPNSTIYITEKLHGTSGRYGRVPQFPVFYGWKRHPYHICSWVAERLTGLKTKHTSYQHCNGSRRVTLTETSNGGYYASNDFRTNLTNGLFLNKGEMLYFEIVGYTHMDSPIMHPQPISKDDKELRKRYGERMVYSYGCNNGENKLFVYRITYLNEDGVEVDLSWNQVEQRSWELGLKTVPLLAVYACGNAPLWDSTNTTRFLQEEVEQLVEGDSTLDASHMREGVVIRIESPHGTKTLKHKSHSFGVLEGYVKDDEAKVDLEEVG